MNENISIYERLVAPFPFEDINWRITNTFNKDERNKKAKSIVVPYLKKETIQDRLDDVFGFDGWSNEYSKWGENAQLCGISFKIGNEFITKYDGAANTEFEEVKGGLSDSFKRAAKMIGIGRYLAKFDAIFLEVDLKDKGGKSYPVIRDIDYQTILKKKYQEEVAKIFSNKIVSPTTSLITQHSIETIEILLEQKNIDINSVLSRYGVNSIEEMAEEDAQKTIKILVKQKSKIA